MHVALEVFAADEQHDRPVDLDRWAALARAVLGAIVVAPGLKNPPEDLSIRIVNGRLTITGWVKDQQQRQVVGAAAESIVGVGKVDNRLETRSGR